MPSDFDDLLAELEAKEALDPDDLDRLRKASSGSPLRKERDEAKARADAAEARAKHLEGSMLADQLTKLGVTVKPSALRVPDDLDVADLEKVRAFAIDAGALAAPVDTSAENQQAHERIGQAMSGGEPAGNGAIKPEEVNSWSQDKQLRFKAKHPDAWELILRGETVTGVAFN